MIRTITPTINLGFKVATSTIATRPFSSSGPKEKSKRLPSFAEIKAVQLEKYIQDIRT